MPEPVLETAKDAAVILTVLAPLVTMDSVGLPAGTLRTVLLGSNAQTACA